MPSGREYPTAPLVGVGALLVNGRRILLVKRGRPPQRGFWSVPGGLVEVGEDTKEAVRREVCEELGVRATVGSLFDVLTVIEKDRSGSVKYHFVIADYVARAPRGPIHLNDESTGYGWFTADQVKKLQMSPRTKSIVLRCLGTETRT